MRPKLYRGTEMTQQVVQVPAREIAPPPVRFDVAGDGPEALMAAAHAEAQSVLGEAEALRASGYQTGYEEGMAQARADAMAEVDETLATLRGLLAGLDHRIDEIEQEAAPMAAALAVEIAARVVRAEVAARPDRVLDVIRGGLRRAVDRERITVRVNPADLAICREAAPDLMASTGGIGRLDFYDDQRVTRGSCILETQSGDIDATFESQLARIHEALFAPPDDDLVEGAL